MTASTNRYMSLVISLHVTRRITTYDCGIVTCHSSHHYVCLWHRYMSLVVSLRVCLASLLHVTDRVFVGSFTVPQQFKAGPKRDSSGEQSSVHCSLTMPAKGEKSWILRPTAAIEITHGRLDMYRSWSRGFDETRCRNAALFVLNKQTFKLARGEAGTAGGAHWFEEGRTVCGIHTVGVLLEYDGQLERPTLEERGAA